MKVWGYKPDGSACLFELEGGAKLPAGWSIDHMIVKDPAKRTAEAITEAAGTTVTHPVRVEHIEKPPEPPHEEKHTEAKPTGTPPWTMQQAKDKR